MDKRVISAVAIIFVAVSFIGIAQEKACAKEMKLGYVDLAKVFEEYNKTKESSKVMEEKVKVKEADRKKLVDEIRKLQDELALLSDKAKAEKQTVIDNKRKGLQDFDMKTQEELVKERNDSVGKIMADIEKVVTEYSKEGGYDLILNSRTLLFGVEGLDLTNEVLKRLNKK